MIDVNRQRQCRNAAHSLRLMRADACCGVRTEEAPVDAISAHMMATPITLR
ncbi:hypothetical protein ACTMU2_32700 [Cupriavidus basilensis]